MEENTELALPQGVMQIKQLPVIMENLVSVKDRVLDVAQKAAAMECTEETLKTCKAKRAELNKLANACEDQRKAINAAILKPYDDFVMVYDDCVRAPLREAVGVLNDKIKSTEKGIKDRAENTLRQFFAETVATRRVDWLKFEQMGIKIGLTEARADNLKKLKQQILDTVDKVADDAAAIANFGEDAPEVMALYKQTLDLASAQTTMCARRMERERERQALLLRQQEEERRRQQLEQEEAQRKARERVSAVFQIETGKDTAAPENAGETQNNRQETSAQTAPAEVYEMAFTVRGTLEQLRALKGYINASGLEVVE